MQTSFFKRKKNICKSGWSPQRISCKHRLFKHLFNATAKLTGNGWNNQIYLDRGIISGPRVSVLAQDDVVSWGVAHVLCGWELMLAASRLWLTSLAYMQMHVLS